MMQGAVGDGIGNALYKNTGNRFYNQPFLAEFQKNHNRFFKKICRQSFCEIAKQLNVREL